MRRKSRGRAVPKRPLRWIDAGNYLNDNESDACAVSWVQVPCGPPEAELDFPGAQEIVRGETDLDFSDKSAPTITRVVGDCTVRAGWLTAINPPGFTAPSILTTPPIVRLGLIVVDEVNAAGWYPPDLFDAADAEEPWMWRAQWSAKEGDHSTIAALAIATEVNQFHVRNNDTWNVHVDVRVNRKISMGESLILVYQWRRNNPGFLGQAGEVLDDLAPVGVVLLQDLRVLVKF